MAKQANRMMIGGFVVAAVFILAASLVVFGSGKFFRDTERFVLYFDGSVKGLSVGAPVLFQGVQIGSVHSIVIRTHPTQLKAQIPVTIEIEPARFEMSGDGSGVRRDPEESVPRLIDMGLRAVLTMQSLITGQLMIECDFYPDTPVNLRDMDREYIEIPTIPSATERISQSLQRLDIDAIQDGLESTLSGIDRLVNSPDLAGAILELKETLTELRHVAVKLDDRIEPITDNLDGALSDVRRFVNNADRQVAPLAENINGAVRDYRQLARNADAHFKGVSGSADRTMNAARGVISEDAPLIVELSETLKEVAAAARAFRQLSQYLEQHPEALIQGRGGSKRK
jgi:paraquat-inducible protein B